jgi:hypothetical protein
MGDPLMQRTGRADQQRKGVKSVEMMLMRSNYAPPGMLAWDNAPTPS